VVEAWYCNCKHSSIQQQICPRRRGNIVIGGQALTDFLLVNDNNVESIARVGFGEAVSSDGGAWLWWYRIRRLSLFSSIQHLALSSSTTTSYIIDFQATITLPWLTFIITTCVTLRQVKAEYRFEDKLRPSVLYRAGLALTFGGMSITPTMPLEASLSIQVG
jgi:hypothetical protein